MFLLNLRYYKVLSIILVLNTYEGMKALSIQIDGKSYREGVNDKYQVKYDVVKQAYAEFQYQSLALTSGLRPDIPVQCIHNFFYRCKNNLTENC